MPPRIKLAVNCLIVAGFTFMGIMAMLQLPILPIDPRLWAGENFDRSTAMGLSFVYTVLLNAIPAALIAWAMLALKPKKLVLYGLVSAMTFIISMQSWSLVIDGNTYGYVRELMLVLTIPLLYWAFDHVLEAKEPA